jgi:hypothetical protein
LIRNTRVPAKDNHSAADDRSAAVVTRVKSGSGEMEIRVSEDDRVELRIS